MKIHGDVGAQSVFHSLRHGFRNLSHNAHSVNSSRYQISLATSIFTVAGLILAFRGRKSLNNLFLSSSSESESSPQNLWIVPGLQNLGNNCFLNVVLQALASCSCFLSSLQKIVEEFEASSEGEQIGDMPLAVSLNALLQELSIVRDKGKVLSPRKVMLAMALYTPNFNLTSQQDAEEALAHMLSSLREECSVCFASNCNSLADATALGRRILTPQRRVIYSDLERWTRSFLGPFNGIIGSILTCQSCSFQISLDFQFFNCLYLSPPTNGGGSIIRGCSIEDCLKRFFVAERLENYFCTHCWHTTALKYLSLLNKNEIDIETVRSCSKQDTCNCRILPSLGSLPWSNDYSHTFKQLHIARSPKILCLNLQRASVNAFGEFIKLKGHVSFPLTLNMSPFQNRGVEIKHYEQNLLISRPAQQNQQSIRYSNIFRLQTNTHSLHYANKQGTESNLTKTHSAEETRQPSSEVNGDGEIQEERAGSCSDVDAHAPTHKNNKVGETCNSTPSGNAMYHLVSVVEHLGSSGSGHYTVYRRVRSSNNNDNNVDVNWVEVSDSHVDWVAEKDVIGATASLLFYQKILES